MKEFIDFIRTQGVVGFAVGFILGRGVSDLVGSLSTNIINPIVGLVMGQFGDLSSMSLHLFSASINYGLFLTNSINFLILALIIYFGAKKLHIEKLDKPKEQK